LVVARIGSDPSPPQLAGVTGTPTQASTCQTERIKTRKGNTQGGMLADGVMGSGAKDNDSQIIGKFVVLRNDKIFL
jgi:hypothetical protein